MNYVVICPGHIALFDQYEAAREFAADFGGQVFNYWGLIDARDSFAAYRKKYPETAALWA